MAQNSKGNNLPFVNKFEGVYVGANFGLQNIFGGAYIDKLDLLAQKTGFVFESSVGYRKQLLKRRLLLGLEIQFGLTEGNLEEIDKRNQANVSYKNNSQVGYGLIVGAALGRKKSVLFFTYLNNTRRNFDITISPINSASFTQEDGQIFLRFGFGIESPILKRFNIRATIGGVNTDYEDLVISQDVNDKLDFNLGLVYRF